MSSTSPAVGQYTAYQSAVNPNCWLVRFGTTGPVYEYQTPLEAANACDALNAAFALGQASREQQWIPVTKEIPDEGDSVLVYVESNKSIYAAYRRAGAWLFFGGDHALVEERRGIVTHWSELPQPPQNR